MYLELDEEKQDDDKMDYAMAANKKHMILGFQREHGCNSQIEGDTQKMQRKGNWQGTYNWTRVLCNLPHFI